MCLESLIVLPAPLPRNTYNIPQLSDRKQVIVTFAVILGAEKDRWKLSCENRMCTSYRDSPPCDRPSEWPFRLDFCGCID